MFDVVASSFLQNKNVVKEDKFNERKVLQLFSLSKYLLEARSNTE